MAEPIFKRMQRIVSAGIENATDAAERLTGGGMMRHAVREVDQAIDKLEQKLAAAKAQALQADWRQAALKDQASELARDARYAMDTSREDLARVAVTRQLELEEEVKRLGQVKREAEREAAQLQSAIGEMKARKTQMEHEYATLQQVQREAAAAGGDPALDRKVQRAEAAFDRARLRAGAVSGAAGAPVGPEVEALRAARREDEISARLASLSGGGKSAAKGGARKASA